MTTQSEKKSMQGPRDKSIVITGGTNGLGKGTILELAKQGPSHILFTGRNNEAACKIIEEVYDIDKNIEIAFVYSEHADLESVAAAARRIMSKLDQIDILILNAGIMGQDAALTKQGYELHFGVNHMAHALMLELFKPLLYNTLADRQLKSRVVVLGSCFPWRPCSGIEFATLKTTQAWWYGGRWARYGQSKLANAAYTTIFAEKNPDLTCICVHPGLIASTGLWDHKLNLPNRLFVKTSSLALAEPMKHAMKIICWVATAPKEDIISGAYYEKIGVPLIHSSFAADPEFRRRLWEWTAKELLPVIQSRCA